MNASRRDVVWKSASVVRNYLTGTRLGIPLASEQFDVMLRILKGSQMPMERLLDLGCGDGILGHVLLDAFPQSSGIFLDFSDPMLDAARQRLGAYDQRAVFVRGDYGDVAWIADVAPKWCPVTACCVQIVLDNIGCCAGHGNL